HHLAPAGDSPGSAAADRILLARKPIRRARRDDVRARDSAGQPAPVIGRRRRGRPTSGPPEAPAGRRRTRPRPAYGAVAARRPTLRRRSPAPPIPVAPAAPTGPPSRC